MDILYRLVSDLIAARYTKQIFLRRDAATRESNLLVAHTSAKNEAPPVCVSSEAFLEKRGRGGEFRELDARYKPVFCSSYLNGELAAPSCDLLRLQ